MKRIGLCIIIISLVLLSGCGKTTKTGKQKEEQHIQLMVASPKSAAAIPLLSMIETNALGDDVKIDLKLYDDLGKMMAIATEDEYGFMVLQVHTAATLYNKGIGAKLINVFGWGGIYLSTTDPECNTWDDLKGKTLYVSAKGSIFDMMTRYFFIQHGLKIEEDVHVVYSSPTEIGQLIKLGKVRYAVDAEPFATMNSQSIKDYKIISDFSKEWQEIKGYQYALPSIGVIVNDGIISNESERIELFSQAFEKALQWTVDHPKEAAGLVEKYMNIDAELIQKAMPNYQFLCKKAIHVKQDTELYYEVLSSFRPESIGGKMPDESFYYNNE